MENSSIFQNKMIENILTKNNSKKSEFSEEYEVDRAFWKNRTNFLQTQQVY